MTEYGDYTPAPHWRGHDFGNARKQYIDVNAGRGYANAKQNSIKASDLIPGCVNTFV